MKKNRKKKKEWAHHKKELHQKRKNRRKPSSVPKMITKVDIEQHVLDSNNVLYEKKKNKTIFNIEPNKEDRICALCKVHKADKQNTHYLSDAIIRRNLNLDGGNSRETGFYYTLGDEPYAKFGFQRNTNIDSVQQELQREPTIDECKAARNNPFSVNDTFCKDCEDKFTSIETKFINEILPKIRKLNSDSKEISIEDTKTTRLFFLLQLWRSSICDSDFNLPKDIEEIMRKILLNSNDCNLDELKQFPISVSFLITDGDEKEFTNNITGFISDEKYTKVIIMNDFILQYYNPQNEFWFDNLYGINELKDYHQYINVNEEKFVMKVIANDKRLKILNNMQQAKAKEYVHYWIGLFLQQWSTHFEKKPSTQVIAEFQEKFSTVDIRSFDIMNKVIKDFINDKLSLP